MNLVDFIMVIWGLCFLWNARVARKNLRLLEPESNNAYSQLESSTLSHSIFFNSDTFCVNFLHFAGQL